MPELPEVQTVVDTLRPGVVGAVVSKVNLRRTDVLTPEGFDFAAGLTGKTISAVERRGKRIVFTMDDGNRFYIHLGMTGRLSAEAPLTPLAPHTHLVVTLRVASTPVETEMRFRDPRRFGGVWWLGSASPAGTMGPEPLKMKPKQLAQRLGRTRRAIKNVLLDQTVVAGLGNIYVDESLFHAGIHPLSVAADLTVEQIQTLNRSIKRVLRKAIRHRGSTLRDYFDANGDPGGFQKLHAVYDRAKLPCRSCKSKIERFVLGGRSTHFCPNCQRHS